MCAAAERGQARLRGEAAAAEARARAAEAALSEAAATASESTRPLLRCPGFRLRLVLLWTAAFGLARVNSCRQLACHAQRQRRQQRCCTLHIAKGTWLPCRFAYAHPLS